VRPIHQSSTFISTPIPVLSSHIIVNNPLHTKAGAKPWLTALAWPGILESQSSLRPSQSQGFQAKLGQNITNCGRVGIGVGAEIGGLGTGSAKEVGELPVTGIGAQHSPATAVR
jgi:hypothetical protein